MRIADARARLEAPRDDQAFIDAKEFMTTPLGFMDEPFVNIGVSWEGPGITQRKGAPGDVGERSDDASEAAGDRVENGSE